MASAHFEEIQRDLTNANVAMEKHKRALVEFQAACMVGDWQRADHIRIEVIAHQEAYLDHLASAYKRSKE